MKGIGMANVCMCGCGELLPEGSTREFKRGHKQRLDNPDSTDIHDETDAAFESAGLTIEDAAAATPDDPEPKDSKESKPKISYRVTASVRRDVEGKLALGFGMLGETWSLIDPLCGQVLTAHGPDMAKKYTPILCQSPEVVRWMTRSGNFLMWIDALMATWPVIQMAVAHHVLHTVVMQRMESPNGHPVSNDYVVQ